MKTRHCNRCLVLDEEARLLAVCIGDRAHLRPIVIEDFHFHDTRHTAARRMAETGAEPSTIKDILGHSDIRMMDRYAHAVESRKRAALERIAEYGRSANVIDLEGRMTG